MQSPQKPHMLKIVSLNEKMPSLNSPVWFCVDIEMQSHSSLKIEMTFQKYVLWVLSYEDRLKL